MLPGGASLTTALYSNFCCLCVSFVLFCRCSFDTEMSFENVKLFVGNLPLDATHDELTKLFAPYGEINTCSLLRQYAFVTLKGEGAADR